MAHQAILASVRARIEDRYRHRTPTSRALHERALGYLPGGDTRTGTSFPPYPTYIDHAQGRYLYDVDGNALLDFTNNATTLIHGHAHPAIVQAIQSQAARGTAWSAPNPLQVQLAGLLCQRVPSLERVRFCNSGTEANMQAIKAARAFTGRDKILKMHGAYHGTYDGMEFGLPALGTGPVPTARGIPRNAADNVLVAHFSDREQLARLVEEHRHELAAVIVTPVLSRGGVAPPRPGHLAFLRELTRANGVLLVFDEVISFRLASGGAQALYGVVPDLTALGKLIGGGLPVGAFGGRADIMEVYEGGDSPGVPHAGTFNGNPLTMAAGIAAMELLTPAAYAWLDSLGAHLRDRLAAACAGQGVRLEVGGVGSLVSLETLRPQPGVPADAVAIEAVRLLHFALLTLGIKTSGILAVSTVMTQADCDQLAAALEQVLRELEPALQAEALHRLGRAVQPA